MADFSIKIPYTVALTIRKYITFFRSHSESIKNFAKSRWEILASRPFVRSFDKQYREGSLKTKKTDLLQKA